MSEREEPEDEETDGPSLSDDEMDEIASRVVDRLQQSQGGDADEAQSDDEASARDEGTGEGDPLDRGEADDRQGGEPVPVEIDSDRGDDAADAGDVHAGDRHQPGAESGSAGADDPGAGGPGTRGRDEQPSDPGGPTGESLGESIRASIREGLVEEGVIDPENRDRPLGDAIRRSVESRIADIDPPTGPAGVGHVNVETGFGPLSPPDEQTAIYKTQLQKGGRIAVPDAEIEALGLEPGDTLQVVCYPVEDEGTDEPQ